MISQSIAWLVKSLKYINFPLNVSVTVQRLMARDNEHT